MQAPSQGNRYLYRIVQSRPSPVVEMSKGLKHAIFRQETARKLTRLKRKYSHLAAILYVATFPISIAVLFCGASEGQILAMISSSLQIPMMVFVVLSLRIDMLRLLLSTYDFWFFSIMNFMTLTLLALSYRDSRVVLAFFTWLNMQYNVSIDATLSNSRGSILASFICVSYRRAVKLEKIQDATSPRKIVSVRVSSNAAALLEHVASDIVYNAEQTLFGYWLSLDAWPAWKQRLFQSSGLLGLDLNGILFLYWSYVAQEKLSPTLEMLTILVGVVASFLTLCFCGICFAYQNPGLLRHVCFSFDYAFLMFQFTVMHLSACDIFLWDQRSFIILSSLIWRHWVLSVDAITPPARHKLGLNLRHTAVLVFTLVVSSSISLYEFANGTKWRLRNRKLMTIKAYGHSVDVMILPVFFTRVLMVLLWDVRLVWRVVKEREENALVVTQGVMAFQQSKISSDLALLPAPHATQICPSRVTS
ncbi:hypothetical protein Poli38472_003441 [Pythium oligandrum]|uniref:Transmembrane protein n=1 Tax=Pythium oligandrum TaxID=41045 RepID=A0A8K1C6J0_PYTOL|nr:hypothetical protein Poli38472_003441 [Pythium oligandrum]|eukprot:TMW57516.1 hypothetical protein Poli38472_003441 [Pythium oligandrum]